MAVAPIPNSSVMLGKYLQQTTTADAIFRCIFLGALRVKRLRHILELSILYLSEMKEPQNSNAAPPTQSVL